MSARRGNMTVTSSHIMDRDIIASTTALSVCTLMRVLTALTIIALCVLAIFRGWGIAEFARAQTVSSRGDADDLPRWVGVPGTTSTALQAMLARTAAVSDVNGAHQHAAILAELLSARPFSSEAWLSLAEMRLIAAR